MFVGTPAATFTTKVMSTWPPAGMTKVLQAGIVAFAAGFVVEGRVAPPDSVTSVVELKVNALAIG